jgi:hypothetical protein
MATPRLSTTPAPAPVERYAVQFDDLFVSRSQRQAFRDLLVGLLRPRDRNKTLTGLADAEPGRDGSHHRETQRLHRFLAESPWDAEAITDRRIRLLAADVTTAPHAGGALLLDDSGDRKKGRHTAHVARQYLGSIGKVDNGIVAVTTAWADDRVYYPLHVIPYEPANRLPKGRDDPGFATKAQLALRLLQAAERMEIAFRAVVADSFYGPSESPGLVEALVEARLPFVLSLKPRQPIAADDAQTMTPVEAAGLRAWEGPEHPGQWQPVTRRFRDGHTETWWATDLRLGGYRIYGPLRLVVLTTDPGTLPALSTWYLATNLPHPDLPGAAGTPFPPASYTELAYLYGLRGWIEQTYRQAKSELGWADFQVRSDTAIRRHWALVNCAFTLGWLDHDDQNTIPADVPASSGMSLDDRPRPAHNWPEGLRRIRACLAPLHAIQRTWRSWTTAPMPTELANLVDALMAGTRLNLYAPP